MSCRSGGTVDINDWLTFEFWLGFDCKQAKFRQKASFHLFRTLLFQYSPHKRGWNSKVVNQGFWLKKQKNKKNIQLFFRAVCSRTQTVCQPRWEVSCCSCQTEQQHRAQRMNVRGSRRSSGNGGKAAILCTVPPGTLETLAHAEKFWHVNYRYVLELVLMSFPLAWE